MIIIAVFSIILSVISPALGLILIILYANQIKLLDTTKYITFYSVWAALCTILYLIEAIDLLTFYNIALNVGLLSFIAIEMLKREKYLENIMLTAFGFTGIVAALKYYLFNEKVVTAINDSTNLLANLLNERFSKGTDDYQMIINTLNASKDLYMKLYYSFAVFTMIIALWIGFIFVNKKLFRPYSHSRYNNSNVLIAIVIIALFLIINPGTKVLGINILIPCIALYFIQGLSVVAFYFGRIIKGSKMLLFIGILSLIFNPYLIVFLAFLGFVDNWADIRKLNKTEKTNENNIN